MNRPVPVREAFARVVSPVLLVSTAVGRGNVSVAEAIAEHLPPGAVVQHRTVEELLSPAAVVEDLERYRFITAHAVWLLHLVYRFPLVYARKYFRERYFPTETFPELATAVRAMNPGTVISVSHRPTFWLAAFRRRHDRPFALWGVVTEFGRTLGWKYLFWEEVEHLLAPLDSSHHDYPLAPQSRYTWLEPPVRRMFSQLAASPGSPDHTLLIAGSWGQMAAGKAERLLEELCAGFPRLHVHAVCGSNAVLRRRLAARFGNHPRFRLYGDLATIQGPLSQCGSVITKPGFSTLIEAHAAGRALFLLPGMPVAEDHNAAYAIGRFGAAWFSTERFRAWQEGRGKAFQGS